MLMNPKVATIGKRRINRTPNFPILGQVKPYGLYPIFCHPVLPGETLQSANIKWRMVSSPVLHPLAGAWSETWLVYVKFTDIDPALGNMFISDTYSTTGFTASGDNERFFVKSGQIDWVRLATEKVYEKYFIGSEETYSRTIDSVPMVKLNNTSWYQNLRFQPTDSAVPTTDATDMYAHLQDWAALQHMGMTEMTYQKYLETFGVSPKNVDDTAPEILRYARSWTQPVNTVDPSTGAPSSAWYWSDDVKMEGKPKRFQEPGFVIALTTVRPKMFQKHIASSMVGNMWGFKDWYPSYNLADPTAGVREIATDDPVFHATFRTYTGEDTLIYDHRDVLSHGEQFINNTVTPIHRIPFAAGMFGNDDSDNQDVRGEYPATADIDALFVSATATDKFLTYEGLASLVVSGHIEDTTR